MTRTSSSRRRFLKSSSLAAAAVALRGSSLLAQSSAQVDAHIDIDPGETIATISPEIYSHFIEHLGGVIYDGVWVGEGSKIANVGGIRKDFIDTMRAVQVPVLRWPGGCFADSYDWRDGIGPRDKRPNRAGFWKQQESNQYGLHEFMRTCRAIGCKPYLAANLRTQPARDFYQEIEYCNAPAGNLPSNSAAPAAPDALAAQREANGDREPFNVDLWGVGNESWGCGGNLTPEEYAMEFRRFTAWTPTYGDTPLRFVAVGPNGDDVDWTSRLFKALYGNPERRHLWGLSVHYYTSGSPTKFAAGDALKFNDDEFYDLLTRGSLMDKVITDHWNAMSSAVPSALSREQPSVKLVVDEWGAWYGKGTELAPEYNLSQQSTMRDALLTGITFDIFQRHADKVGVAAVAQSINCIHSLMLAQGDRFCVTPTFHVFQMYLPHRGAQSVRADFTAASIPNPMGNTASQVGGNSYIGQLPPIKSLAGLSGSASVKGKSLTLTVVNPHLTQPMTTEIAVRGASIASAKGTVLAEKDVHAHNDFAHPDAVKPRSAGALSPAGGKLTHSFPPASVTSLEIALV
ncbi:alpha-N-arabinofuranosidase [Edaphobacter sp. 12200R-103]|uniref:alpha-N-arabinofuranosidase n=1 Tax=Edaphobacter sp. 12200R-103 TaxID=2703788 RepID=UPI00138C96CB|nr:alpha-L-arabinofuranosidase C-terminal domain-containing protein [Edaphobacter sp. 12200R-103]QHS52704.1 alpha-L-arabinofuranosidase [Edaphobacter sp. 12200R-103]